MRSRTSSVESVLRRPSGIIEIGDFSRERISDFAITVSWSIGRSVGCWASSVAALPETVRPSRLVTVTNC
jgi:hypothetical protein